MSSRQYRLSAAWGGLERFPTLFSQRANAQNGVTLKSWLPWLTTRYRTQSLTAQAVFSGPQMGLMVPEVLSGQSCAHLSWATEHGILFRKLRKESCHIHLSQTSSVFETRQFAGSAVWKPPCKSAKFMRNFEILKRQVFWFYALQSCKIFRLKALYWIWRMPVTSDHGSSKFLKLIKFRQRKSWPWRCQDIWSWFWWVFTILFHRSLFNF